MSMLRRTQARRDESPVPSRLIFLGSHTGVCNAAPHTLMMSLVKHSRAVQLASKWLA